MSDHSFTHDPDETASRLERYIARGRERVVEDAITALTRVLEDERDSDLGWSEIKYGEDIVIIDAMDALKAIKDRLT